MLNAHYAVLGKTGSGKSSLLRLMVEDKISRHKRVCVIDPKGDWYGLKLTADGRKANNDVITFGDFVNEDAADVPINEHSGRHIAELISSGNRPCVIGFRGWMPGRMTKFWIDFASTLFNSKSGELYLDIDEAHNFAPKGKVLDPEAGKSLHWTNRILSEGRGLGLIIGVASQRPQKVHNDTLTCCETLFAMRVVHAADRNAIEDWIEGCGDKVQGVKVLNELASMARGEAYVWSPENNFGPKRVQFPLFATFDSFAPPQLQKKITSAGWAGVDLEEVKAKLSKVIEETKANDPKELKKQNAELRKALQTSEARVVKVEPLPAEKIYVVRDEDMALIERARNEFAQLRELLNEKFESTHAMMRELNTLHDRLLSIKTQGMKATVPRTFSPLPRTAPRVAPQNGRLASATPPATNGDLHLSKTQQRILDALAWFESIGTQEPTALQVGAVALIDSTGGHFSNTVGPLSSSGLIVRGNGTLQLTDDGRKYARVPDSLGTMEDYHQMLRERVRRCNSAGGKTVEMLNAIIERGDGDITAQELGEAVDIDHTGGHFSNMIGPLGTLGLIERRNGVIRPTEILFPSALA